MDFESASRYSENISALNDMIDNHVPVLDSAEQGHTHELDPVQRFNNIWDQADLLFGNRPHPAGGIIPAHDKNGRGEPVRVRLSIQTEPAGLRLTKPTRVIAVQWSSTQPIGKPEVIKDNPDFLKGARDPKSPEGRNLKLVEQSLAAIIRIRTENKLTQLPIVIFPPA